MAGEAEQQLRAYVDYLRDMGIHDFYRHGEPVFAERLRRLFRWPLLRLPPRGSLRRSGCCGG